MMDAAVKERLVFRCDATARIGVGHVMRCLTLADEAAARGHDVRFVCGPETRQSAPALARSGFEVSTVTEDGSMTPIDLVAAVGDGPAILVVDGEAFNAASEQACRPFFRSLVALDDLADRPHACDFLLNSAPGLSEKAYAPHVPADARLLLGPRYALVHRNFLAAREGSLARRSIARPACRILIAFGGTDPANGTSLALAALAGLPDVAIDVAIDVALGAIAPHLPEVAARTAALHGRLHIDVLDMPALVAAADIAVGAGGSSVWERCALGLPSIIVTIAENQRNIARAVAAAGAAIDLGDRLRVDVRDIRNRILGLIGDQAGLMEMAVNAAALVDGRGGQRVLDHVTALQG